MKIARHSARAEGSSYRPGRSLLGERERSTALVEGGVRLGGGAINLLADGRLLLQYASDGDQSAFTALVEKYQSMVMGAALRHTRNAELAREVAQEVFAALAGKARTLAKRDSLAGWLHRAALYESVHVLKAESRRRARHERYSNQMEMLATPGANKSRSAERLAVIDEALNDLPETDREALVLHYFQDLSYPEMAKTLALSEPAVRQRVSRALHHLELALRSRGCSGNAVVLLLAAVATQSGVAIPVGLPAGALMLAQSGASSSLPWFVSGLLSKSTKTIALILAGAGTALFWQTNPAAPRTADAASITSRAERTGGELTSEAGLVRFASRGQEAPAAAPATSEAGRQRGMVRQGARRPDPTGPRARPVAALTSPDASTQSLEVAATREAPSRAITREAAEAPEALEAMLEASPRLAWELREAELIPLHAAELYGGLLTQLLSLNEAQKVRVEEFLIGHYTQLGDRGIAGPRPADFPPADWRSAREAALADAVAGVEAAAEADAPVIKTVFTLPDELDALPGLDADDGTIIDL